MRRCALAFGVTLLVLCSASAAWTAIAQWRPVQVFQAADSEASLAEGRRNWGANRPLRVVPPASPANVPVASSVEGSAEENAVYALAHRAHFIRDAPALALQAWNQYVQRYPGGIFVPEARYNRAICLVRLGRLVEAAAALRPFANGGMDGYRRKEATVVLGWIAEKAAGE